MVLNDEMFEFGINYVVDMLCYSVVVGVRVDKDRSLIMNLKLLLMFSN